MWREVPSQWPWEKTQILLWPESVIYSNWILDGAYVEVIKRFHYTKHKQRQIIRDCLRWAFFFFLRCLQSASKWNAVSHPFLFKSCIILFEPISFLGTTASALATESPEYCFQILTRSPRFREKGSRTPPSPCHWCVSTKNRKRQEGLWQHLIVRLSPSGIGVS